MSEKIRVLLPEEELDSRIKEVAEQISKDFEGETVLAVCILRGAAYFACELTKRLTVPVVIDFMTTSSYGASTVSSGEVKVKKEIEIDPAGQNVLIIEDIIDSGNTLNFLKKYFKDKNAKSKK